jgi:hypothetical protein
MVGALLRFAIAPQVNANEPRSLAARNDLTNLAGHKRSSFFQKQTCFRGICKLKFRGQMRFGC